MGTEIDAKTEVSGTAEIRIMYLCRIIANNIACYLFVFAWHALTSSAALAALFFCKNEKQYTI